MGRKAKARPTEPKEPKEPKERQRQAFPTFPAFQWWVICKLEKIVASKAPGVVNYMVTRWIEEHDGDLLKRYGASFEDWQGLQRPQGLVRNMDARRREVDAASDEATKREDGNGADGGS